MDSQEPKASSQSELLARLNDALNQRDLPTILNAMTSDVVFDDQGEVSKGIAAVHRRIGDWLTLFENYESTITEFIEVADDVTLVVTREAGVPLEGSVRMEGTWPLVIVWKNDKIKLLIGFGTVAEARLAGEQLAKEQR